MDLPELIGDLVILRKLDVEKDASSYFNVSLDKNIHTWVGNNVPKSIDEIKNLLFSYEKCMFVWMIINRQTSEIIGIMRISFPELVNSKLVAGDSQRLLSKYWRKGHMKEARNLIYEFAYTSLKIETLYADVWEENINSLESLKSIGYQIYDRKEEFFEKGNIKRYKCYLELNLRKWYIENRNY